jgi:peptidoglycan-N-acetylglucosamine deacetylase
MSSRRTVGATTRLTGDTEIGSIPKHYAAITVCAALIAVGQLAHAGGQVALTFDDLPVHSPVPAGLTRTELMKQIVNTLRHSKGPPVYGFINAASLPEAEDHREALHVWRAAGLPLANHTYSHMDLHANDVAAFREQVIANEPVLESLMGQEDWRWFRYPYLREGNTMEKRVAVRELLAERHYKIAQVTIDFQDYAYHAPYVRCLEKGDLEAIQKLKESYLARAADTLTQSELVAKRIYGRDIKHVMLLHVGAFQPMMLPHLFSLLETREYKLVPLALAQSDPAYAEDSEAVLPNGTSFLDQMSIKRRLPRPDYWEQELEVIDQLCR